MLAGDGVEQRQVRPDGRAAGGDPLLTQRVELALQVVGQGERDDERVGAPLAATTGRAGQGR